MNDAWASTLHGLLWHKRHRKLDACEVHTKSQQRCAPPCKSEAPGIAAHAGAQVQFRQHIRSGAPEASAVAGRELGLPDELGRDPTGSAAPLAAVDEVLAGLAEASFAAAGLATLASAALGSAEPAFAPALPLSPAALASPAAAPAALAAAGLSAFEEPGLAAADAVDDEEVGRDGVLAAASVVGALEDEEEAGLEAGLAAGLASLDPGLEAGLAANLASLDPGREASARAVTSASAALSAPALSRSWRQACYPTYALRSQVAKFAAWRTWQWELIVSFSCIFA